MQDVFGLLGTTIDGAYRVDALVGEGGFGIVYRGFHLAFEHEVAVKCLKVPGHFTADAQRLFFEKFRDEGKLLSKLSSAHLAIVRVFHFGVAKSGSGAMVPYLVLEWLDGRDLEADLRERPAPYGEREAVALLRPALEAIAIAHKMGIAHRDLKPANLFITRTPTGTTLKVLDFGIAKAMQEGETATRVATRTSSGFSAFSPQYGAPEQFFSKRYGATGPWTDVHALGLILTQLVTGRVALDGEEQQELYEAATSAERPTPRSRAALVSDAFEAVCARALARMPKERFQDAGELLAALDALEPRVSMVGAAPVPVFAPAPVVEPRTDTPVPVLALAPVVEPAATPFSLAESGGRGPGGTATPVVMPSATATLEPVPTLPSAPLVVPTVGAVAAVPRRRGALGLVLGVVGVGALVAVLFATRSSGGPVDVAGDVPRADSAASSSASSPRPATAEATAPAACATVATPATPGSEEVAAGDAPGAEVADGGVAVSTARPAASATTGPGTTATTTTTLPTISTTSPEPGRLDQAIIQRVVRQGNSRYRACFERALRSNPNLSGKVTVSFTIAADGHVQSASASSTVPDPSVGPCVAQQFLSLSFPPPEGGGTVRATYPIVFAAG